MNEKSSILSVQEFLESKEHEHIVLIHDKPSIEHELELKFIKTGLEKGQICLYTTNNIQSTKERMKSVGIDVNRFEENNELHIIEIPKSFKEYEKIILKIVNDVQKYSKKIRLVSTHNFDFTTKENIESMIKIEHNIDDIFSKVPGNMICSFSLNNMNKMQSKEFVTKLLDSHKIVIFIHKDTPIWFNLP